MKYSFYGSSAFVLMCFGLSLNVFGKDSQSANTKKVIAKTSETLPAKPKDSEKNKDKTKEEISNECNTVDQNENSEAAFNQKDKTVNQKPNSRKITIFFNEKHNSTVQDIRKIRVENGNNKISLHDIPFSSALVINPLEPWVNVVGYEYRSLNKPLFNLLKTAIGKSISYKVDGEFFQGQLINVYHDENLNKDIIVTNRGNVCNFTLLEKCRYLSLHASGKFNDSDLLVDLFADKSGDADIELNYITNGIRSDIMYVVETDLSVSNALIKAIAVIKNETNIDFQNVNLIFDFLTDKITEKRMTANTDFIGGGIKKIIALKNFEKQELTSTYQVRLSRDFAGANTPVQVKKILSVKCPFSTKEYTTPGSRVNAMLKLGKNSQFSSCGIFDGRLLFDVGTEENIKVNVKRINTKNLLNDSKDVSFVVTIKNELNTETDIEINLDLGAKYDIIRESVDRFSSKPIWKVLIPANGEKEIYFRVKLWN